MKLYYGGFGDYMEFTVAENEADAIRNIGIKINAPFLPIKVIEISEVDGYQIHPLTQIESLTTFSPKHPATFDEKPIEAEGVIKTFHCKHAGCDFSSHSLNELSQHGRKEHPKGD